MRRSVSIVACAVAALTLSVAVTPAVAKKETTPAAKPVTVSCGQTITTDTKLANDLTDCPSNGIIIGADNITLDLNGHTIDGTFSLECDDPAEPGCGDSSGVLSEDYERITVEGGSIQEFSSGASIVGGADHRLRRLSVSGSGDGMDVILAPNTLVTQNSVVDNVFGVFVARSDGTQVERNRVMGYRGCGLESQRSQRLRIEGNSVFADEPNEPITGDACGIGLFNESGHSRIERNSISGNGFAGLLVASSDGNVVTENHISKSGEVGASLIGDHNTITRNRVVDTVGGCEGCGAGISFEGGTGNLIANNTVERTQQTVGIQFAAFEPETPPAIDNVARANVVRDGGLDGIAVRATAADTLLDRNVVTGNEDDGIDVESPATTLKMNTANQNQDLGIEAVPGVIDGGGNRASSNGNPLQCTNVFCG